VTGYRKQPRHQGVFYRKAYCRLLVYVYVCVTGRRILGQRPSCNNPTREQRGGHRNSDIQFGAKARGFARPASSSRNPLCVRCSASHTSAGDERGQGGVTVVLNLSYLIRFDGKKQFHEFSFGVVLHLCKMISASHFCFYSWGLGTFNPVIPQIIKLPSSCNVLKIMNIVMWFLSSLHL
jgi:hypothetical protein